MSDLEGDDGTSNSNSGAPDDVETWDLAIVGAGPAGSICATVAAERGLRVALIDQREFPRDKSCGDGLGPGGAALLTRLGLADVLAGEVPIGRVDIIGPDGTTASTDVPVIDGKPQLGYVVARKTLDHRLFTAAVTAGATDFTGHKLTAAAAEAGHRELTLRRGDTETTMRCRLLVGADGPYSTVRRLLSVPPHPKRHTMIAMRAYTELTAEFDPRLIFEFDRDLLPGYGWIFPDGHGSANVGVAVHVLDLQRDHVDLRSRLDSFVVRSQERGFPLGELRGHRSHHLPLATSTPRLAHHRAVLVGDSAAMINPMSGEGIVYAMTAAEELARRCPTDLTDAAALDNALRGYETWFRKAYRRHMRANYLLGKAMSKPRIATKAVQRLSRNPADLTSTVELIFDTSKTSRETPWTTILWQTARTLLRR